MGGTAERSAAHLGDRRGGGERRIIRSRRRRRKGGREGGRLAKELQARCETLQYRRGAKGKTGGRKR